jgi:hypothetical protein
MFGESPRKPIILNAFPTAKHGGSSVINWAAISWYTAGPIITLNI